MASSPHQPTSLADEITELKRDLAEKKALRSQIQTLGQSVSGGGAATTYPNLRELDAAIARLSADIKAKTDQLNGDSTNLQPGMNTLAFNGDYN